MGIIALQTCILSMPVIRILEKGPPITRRVEPILIRKARWVSSEAIKHLSNKIMRRMQTQLFLQIEEVNYSSILIKILASVVSVYKQNDQSHEYYNIKNKNNNKNTPINEQNITKSPRDSSSHIKPILTYKRTSNMINTSNIDHSVNSSI